MRTKITIILLCVLSAGLPLHPLLAKVDENVDRAVVRIVNGLDPDKYGAGFIVAYSQELVYIITARINS